MTPPTADLRRMEGMTLTPVPLPEVEGLWQRGGAKGEGGRCDDGPWRDTIPPYVRARGVRGRFASPAGRGALAEGRGEGRGRPL